MSSSKRIGNAYRRRQSTHRETERTRLDESRLDVGLGRILQQIQAPESRAESRDEAPRDFFEFRSHRIRRRRQKTS